MKSLSKTLFTGILIMTFGLGFTLNSAIAQDGNVVDVVTSDDENTLFAELLEETDMPQVLGQQGPYTVLVPTDDAIESLDTSVEELKENPDRLQDIIRNHLYQGKLASNEIESALDVTVTDGDKEASNGVVHTVDEVVQRN